MIDIVNIEDVGRKRIEDVIDETRRRKRRYESGRRTTNELAGRNVANLFWQKSTRTYGSFETAAHRLGAHLIGFRDPSATSSAKNESLFGTAQMYQNNHDADVIVMRHPNDGSVQWIADTCEIPVINGGDGRNQHPTQTLLDLVTIDELHPGIDNLHIGFGGDLKNGRTVHSLPMGLSHFNDITLHLVSPEILAMPKHYIDLFESNGLQIKVHEDLRDCLENCSIFYQTRPQLNMSPLSAEEMYAAFSKYRITQRILDGLDTYILHPLPIDMKNAEIDFDVTFTKNQYWLPQARNGPFTRETLLVDVINPKGYVMCNGIFKDASLTESNCYIDKRIKRGTPKKGVKVVALDNGIVIDHLPLGSAHNIRTAILESMHGEKPTIIPAENLRPIDNPYGDPIKDMIKIEGNYDLTPRMVKSVLKYAPDATFNKVRNRKVVEKKKALLCENDDPDNGCIDRVIEQDVTSRYELLGNLVRCRYCQTPHSLNVSITKKELKEYLKTLPKVCH